MYRRHGRPPTRDRAAPPKMLEQVGPNAPPDLRKQFTALTEVIRQQGVLLQRMCEIVTQRSSVDSRDHHDVLHVRRRGFGLIEGGSRIRIVGSWIRVAFVDSEVSEAFVDSNVRAWTTRGLREIYRRLREVESVESVITL
uniref:Uncharacterized protein n=1 Tax=Ananas comosus var. bracteatus TaxID=296719 RepID=A0A6V7PSL9_ANACO|nr:unnamed protein product [Ananas comosus var. bracteatus]